VSPSWISSIAGLIERAYAASARWVSPSGIERGGPALYPL